MVCAINNQSMWSNPLLTATLGSAGQSSATTGAFSSIVSGSNGGAAGSATTAGSVGSGTSSASVTQLSQDVDAFTQSLLQALASTSAATQAQATNAVTSNTSTNAGGASLNSGAGNASDPTGGTGAIGHSGHHHGGLAKELASLIGELNDTSTPGGTSSNPALSTLNTTFNQLVSDLGTTGSASTSPTNPTGTSGSASPSTTTALTLPNVLGAMLQRIQHSGGWTSPVGQTINAVA
jgi:hypothetical protein